MFDRHRAEIIFMQFTGHSLPVHQSMSVPWDFNLSHISAKPAYAIFSHNCHWNVSLPSRASLWNSMFGQVEGQYPTFWCIDFLTPPTSVIIPHTLLAFLESLMPLKNSGLIHARWSKSRLKHSIRFCGIFSKFKTQFYSISFF